MKKRARVSRTGSYVRVRICIYICHVHVNRRRPQVSHLDPLEYEDPALDPETPQVIS